MIEIIVNPLPLPAVATCNYKIKSAHTLTRHIVTLNLETRPLTISISVCVCVCQSTNNSWLYIQQ